jgi:hypothetical protein
MVFSPIRKGVKCFSFSIVFFSLGCRETGVWKGVVLRRWRLYCSSVVNAFRTCVKLDFWTVVSTRRSFRDKSNLSVSGWRRHRFIALSVLVSWPRIATRSYVKCFSKRSKFSFFLFHKNENFMFLLKWIIHQFAHALNRVLMISG